MPNSLKISLGQFSDKGRKSLNQDFHGAVVPDEPHLTRKGIAVALADGISSSGVSQIASEAAVKSFLTDYFCTPDTWSAKKSAQSVLVATNAWLHAQTRQSGFRYDLDRGYVCTFSGLILKGALAHLFHAGDARVYRLRDGQLEQLTSDHRVWVSQETSYLSRALGFNSHIEIDYQSFPVELSDYFLLMTDGIYEFVSGNFLRDSIRNHPDDLDQAARLIAAEACQAGSTDNLTIQIVRIDAIPEQDADGGRLQLAQLPLPPMLDPGMNFDGYRIVRQLHASSRSRVFLALDTASQATVALKIPAIDLRDNPQFLERFAMEEWIARRINSEVVLKAGPANRTRNYLYMAMEFIDGQTLAQWMTDHPAPDLEAVRKIIEQVARGLRAFHKLEMVHQDLRPNNIMIDRDGTVRIIDFGSVRIAGLQEANPCVDAGEVLGTAQFTAPEYFLGEGGSGRSDIFSLGVIAYQMLSGDLPYGTRVVQARTRQQQQRLQYQSLLRDDRAIPLWVDGAIRKAVHVDPNRRYQELSEFVYDLRHPNPEFFGFHTPLMQKNPILFWKGVSLMLLLVVLALVGHIMV